MAQLLVLVEDDVVIGRGVATSLEIDGYVVKLLTIGRDVIRTITETLPAAVIMDIMLPDVDGAAIGQLVRQMWPALPIIFITGHLDYPGLEMLVGDGRTLLLNKPFRMTELSRALSKMIPDSPDTVQS